MKGGRGGGGRDKINSEKKNGILRVGENALKLSVPLDWGKHFQVCVEVNEGFVWKN